MTTCIPKQSAAINYRVSGFVAEFVRGLRDRGKHF